MEDNKKETLWDVVAAMQPAAEVIKQDVDTSIINDMLADAADKDAEERIHLSSDDFMDNGSIITSTDVGEITFTYDGTLDYNNEYTLNVEDLTITTNLTKDTAVVIRDEHSDLIVEIKQTGEVTLGSTIKPQYAAHEFWHRVAEVGGRFEERFAELEEDYEDEQSMRLELQEIITDIASALGVPEAMEHDIADHAAKMKEQLEAATALIGEQALETLQKIKTKPTAEDPADAYKRAMKVVRG
jgi:hypothetical protein